jgi:putative membrane protein
MERSIRDDRFCQWLLLGLVAVWVVTAIRPFNRWDWLLENLLVFAFVGILVATYRRFAFSNLSYVLIAIFLALHLVGAHYTYSATPLGFWLQDALDLSRNHYDRILHFLFGLLLAYPLRELLIRAAGVKPAWSYLLVVVCVLGFSGFYEALEGLVAFVVSPELGSAYLGTQGDEWDAQKDTALALAGAVIAMAFVWSRSAPGSRRIAEVAMKLSSLAGPGMAWVLAIVLAGCESVVSVEPVVPESEAILDDRLVGTWEHPETGQWVIMPAGEGEAAYFVRGQPARKFYVRHDIRELCCPVNGKLARLGRVGDTLVLELLPGEPAPGTLTLPGHFLVILEFVPEGLRFETLSGTGLHNFLRARQSDLGYKLQPWTSSYNDLVLYDTTDRVRAELAEYLRALNGLKDAPTLVRVDDMSFAGSKSAVAPPCFEASGWPEADRLLERDPRFQGFYSAATVDLGGERILWNFALSWVDPTGSAELQLGSLDDHVDSIALQSGTNPADARVEFHWRMEEGSPSFFLPILEDDRPFLMGSGMRIRDRLVLFLGRRLEFGSDPEFLRWAAVLVENPDDDPSTWRMRQLDTPENPLSILLGEAAVLQLDGYVYAFGPEYRPDEGMSTARQLYVARWPEAKVYAGNLGEPEWWGGEKLGWLPDARQVQRSPLFEYWDQHVSIHFDAISRRFLAVHARRGESMDVVMRAAPALVGPWSEPRLIHRPAENFVARTDEDGGPYDARAHPEFTGADLVLSYSIAEPRPGIRFLRLARCDMGVEP